MSQELREALVEVGQETAVSTPNTDTVILAFDTAGNAMKPITPQSIVPDVAVQKLESDITVTVGTGGDYATINEAIVALTKSNPIYANGGVKATINLLSGFVVTEAIIVEGIDLRWITITGEDAVTVIDASTIPVGENAIFEVNNGGLPVIGQLFDMEDSGGINGIMANYDSNVYVKADAGIINCSGGSIVAYGGSLYIKGSKFSGAGANGLAGECFRAYAWDADFSNASKLGIRAGYGAVVDAEGVNATGAGTFGLQVIAGGIIAAVDSTGTLSQTALEVLPTGIIFK